MPPVAMIDSSALSSTAWHEPWKWAMSPSVRRFSKAATLTDFQAMITFPSAGCACERSRSQLAA